MIIGASETRVRKLREEFSKAYKKFLASNLDKYSDKNLILVNKAPNRIGKSTNTLLLLSEVHKIFFCSDRHQHLEELIDYLRSVSPGLRIGHWEGLRRLMEKKDFCIDKQREYLLLKQVPPKIACDGCELYKACAYWKQFDYDVDIVFAPKEYIVTTHLNGFNPDIIVWDENIDKKRSIESFIPHLNIENFEEHGSEYFGHVHSLCKSFKNKRLPKSILTEFSDFLQLHIHDIYIELLKLIKSNKTRFKFKSEPIFDSILKFYLQFKNTAEWVEHCIKEEFREVFYEPLIKYAINYPTPLIILNTSFNQEIFESLLKNNGITLPMIKEFVFDVPKNDSSYLIHLNKNKKSFSKSKLFVMDEFSIIKLNSHDKPILTDYGEEIYEMALYSIEFYKRKGLKVGMITYKEVLSLFEEKVDEISYYGGNQGSNILDDMDVLILFGTFNKNPSALSEMYQFIYNEKLPKHKWNKPIIINGNQFLFSNNEKINSIKKHMLFEEHQQSMFRNGAHIIPGKIIIAFCHVPPGCEKNLNYQRFNGEFRLKMMLGKITKKILKIT